MHFSYHRLFTSILAWLLFASFIKQGALVDSGRTPLKVQVLPLAFSLSKDGCKRLYTRCSTARSSNQPVPSKSVFLSCKRNGWTSGIAVSIFLMNLTQSTMFKDMYGARRQVRIRSVKLVKIKNNALLYVLYT
jgi:hypothetical protein